jgi:hypothetical protein
MSTKNTENTPPDVQQMLPFDPPLEEAQPEAPDLGAQQPDARGSKVAKEIEDLRTEIADLRSKLEHPLTAQAPLPPIDGGAGRMQPGNILTREALARMKPADIAQLDWDDVRQILSS